MRRWWLPVLLHIVLLGGFYAIYHSYSLTTREGSTRTTSRSSGWDYGCEASWTGGYKCDTNWEEEFADAFDTTTPPIVTWVLALLLGLVALVVKVHIMRGILAMRETGPPTS